MGGLQAKEVWLEEAKDEAEEPFWEEQLQEEENVSVQAEEDVGSKTDSVRFHVEILRRNPTDRRRTVTTCISRSPDMKLWIPDPMRGLYNIKTKTGTPKIISRSARGLSDARAVFHIYVIAMCPK